MLSVRSAARASFAIRIALPSRTERSSAWSRAEMKDAIATGEIVLMETPLGK